MASYLSRGLKLTASRGGHFTDVHARTAFASSINRLVPAGVAFSCASHRFCPTRSITRAETAGFLQRALSITRVTAKQPVPGNPDGHCRDPGRGRRRGRLLADHVVGNGTPASCTSQRVVDAVAKGGIITFDCGAEPGHDHADRDGEGLQRQARRSSSTAAARSR